MAALREQTRRFWVTATFLLLGPVALIVTSWRLYERAKQNAPVEESSYLSSQLGCNIEVGRREFLSPGFSRFIDARISSRLSSSAILVCPELYAIRSKDEALLEQLANSIDERRIVDQDKRESATLFESIKEDAPSPADARYNIVVIPEIIVNAREVRQAQNILSSFFSGVFQTLTSSTQGVACFAVEKITIIDAEDFSEIADVQSESLGMKKRDVLEIASVLFRQTPRGVGGITETSTKNEVLAFSAEPITIDMTRALYVESKSGKRLYGLFELQKISCPEPCYFAVETTNDRRSAFSLRSEQTPLPGSFLSLFSDSFNFLQEEGWFSGRIETYRAPVEDAFANGEPINPIRTEERQTTRLANCSFKRFDLRKIASSFGVSQFSGLVTELAIQDGVIQNGTIKANGFVRINEGTLPANLVGRLHRLGKLNAAPSNATKLRFVNNATPFNKLELQFALGESGITFDSNYRNKIVAFYEQDALKYGFYLPENVAGQTIPYADVLSDLYDSNEVQAAWKPFTKYVLNRVPLGEAGDAANSKDNLR